ncbi:DUF6383 domain-containing protein [uncultured Parabacteroides sp.]|uniref:DUF6383 domain-containing protein n=1 Tax=uncultured Parabacteroides sp. TaxID=512312 RepID=UPI00262E9825|nr:DUF6383 domain-containing protein [uncultured Parabacteroides sp.]
MNKRFSTLLAAALVAGGFSFNAMADAYPVGEYIQIKVGEKFLTVGEGVTRDSLALATDPAKETVPTLEKYNKTLWKLNLTPYKDANGLIEGYYVSVENKVNGPVTLTKADAAANKSEYYAPGAVVAPGVQYIATVGADKYAEGKVTLDDIDFTPAAYYDAAAKKVVGYQLNTAGDVIKLMCATVDAKDIKTSAELAEAVKKLTFTGTKATATVAALAASPVTMKASMLNAIGNEAFQLFFSKDITDNAKFTNPFSANELQAVENAVYSAAKYDLSDFNDAVEAANEVVSEVADFKGAINAYVAEITTAMNETATAAGAIAEKAPNKADITATATPLASDEVKKLFKTDGDVAKKVAALLTQAADKDNKYENVAAADAPEVYKVKDAAAKLKKVTDARDAAVKEIDKLAASAAITKVKAAVANFATGIYRIADEKVDYTDYKVSDKTADAALKAIAAGYADAHKTTLEALVAENVVTVTPSAAITANSYYPYAVVGEKDTYVVVDTAYVASKEKYMSLGTTKLNEVVVLKSGKAAVDVTDDDYEFDESTMEKILVPNLGSWATPALFKMDVAIKNVEQGDSILIYANAWKEPTGSAKYYSDATDAVASFEPDKNVVIRTLGNSREASILLATGENTDAVKNTKISFTEPKLATLVKDGAIYFVVEKTKASEKEGKYRVSTPADFTTWAKVAYENVPGTQFVATKNGNIYSLDNRDFAASVVKGQKLYVVGEEKDMIYTTSARDTFQLVEIADAKDEHLGYKFITEPIQQISDYVLSAINYANPEVPFFLTFDGNADSTLIAAKDQTKALGLKAMLDENKKEVTSAYDMNDKNLEKQYYQLYAKDGKDTLYIDVNEDNELVVTKVPTNLLLQFRNVNNEANEYEVLIGAYDASSKTYQTNKKVSYNQNGQAVAVNLDEATAFVYDLTDNSTDIYKNFEITEPTSVIISIDGDEASKVTAVKPFAVIKRTGLDLKAAATDNDFVLGLDTAYVNRKNNIRYAYYITKPIDVEKTGSFDKKAYMVSYNDSIVAKRSNDTVKYEQDNLTRIGFVHAQRVEFGENDSLAISKVKPVATDTIYVAGNNKGVTPATWAFAIESDGTYRIETAADANGNKYVSYLNGILVLGNREQAQLFNVNSTDLTPTDNEKIATSEVTVIAGEGQVTIAGAQGKKVVVTNVLGQVITNTVITSDNAPIAAPQGVVVVAVEGEEAVKAIVK